MNLNKMKIGATLLVTARNESYEDFADELDNRYFFDDMMQDGSKEIDCLKAMENEAKKKGVQLSGKDEFNYEDYFYKMKKSKS